MDLLDYCREIARLWPQAGQAPNRELVEMCLQAVSDYPESSTLWYNLGIVMERCSEDEGFGADDYLRCFENSVRYDPTNAEAYQELGYVLDVYFDDYVGAERALRKAIRLGGGHESYCALARVLAQMSRTQESLDAISEENCPYHRHPEIQKLRMEVESGIWRGSAEESKGDGH